MLTGNPWNSPAAMLAAPIPTISWLPCTRSPLARGERLTPWTSCRPGRPRRSRAAPTNSGDRSSDQDTRDGERREALRQYADRARPRAPARSNTLTTSEASDDRDEHGRHLGQQPLQHQDPDQGADAQGSSRRVGLAVREPGQERRASSTRPSASMEKPSSLGSWPTTIVMASPFM